MRLQLVSVFALVVCCGSLSGQVRISKKPAQTKPLDSTPPLPAKPDEPPDRNSPYQTVYGFLRAASNGDYKTAAEYLDNRDPGQDSTQLARQLRRVFDRSPSISIDSISRNPEGGLTADAPPTNRVLVGTYREGSFTLPIYLDRIDRVNATPLWLFAADTLKMVPATAEVEPTWLESHVDTHVPVFLRQSRVLYLPLSRWLYAVIYLLIATTVSWLAGRLLSAVIERVIRRSRPKAGWTEYRLTWPIAILVMMAFLRLEWRLSTTFVGRAMIERIFYVVVVLAVTWLGMKCIDFAAAKAAGRLTRPELLARSPAIHLVSAFCKMLLAVGAVVLVLVMNDVHLATAAAGLGVGGIAIAFAAQKTIENLFGTLTFVTDQLAGVGDLCRVGNYLGTIEEVGLRSTRMRTVDDTVLTIPNGQLTSQAVENIALRGKMLFRHRISLSTTTSPESLRSALSKTEEVMKNDPRVEMSSAYARLVSVERTSFEVELFAYILTTRGRDFLDVQQALLLEAMEQIGVAGAVLAGPVVGLLSPATVAAARAGPG